MTQDETEIETETEIENTARDRHQLQTLVLAVVAIGAVLSAVAVVIVYTIALNRLWFLNFPLGFWLLAQGLVLFAVFIVFWYVRVQERIDHTRSMNEEIA